MTDESAMPPSLQRFLDTLAETYADHQLEMVGKSFFLLERDVRKHRLHSIINLSVERQRLLDEHGRNPGRPDGPQGFQASDFMESTIEHLITGDFTEVRVWADMYLFAGEGKWAEPWIEVYAKFRAIAHAATTEPGDVQ